MLFMPASSFSFRFLFIRLPFMGITESHSMCMKTPPLNSPLIHLSFSILQLSKRHFWANKTSKTQLTNRNIHRKTNVFFIDFLLAHELRLFGVFKLNSIIINL